MLGQRLVDRDDRVLENALRGHRPEPHDAGGGLLGAAGDLAQQVGALPVEHGDKVGAVVHREVGPVLERARDVRVVGVVVLALDGEGGDMVLDRQRGGDRVVGRERIGGAEHDVGPARLQRQHQVGGLAGHVEAGRDAQPGERLLLPEAVADEEQHGHLTGRPVDQSLAFLGQRTVLYVAFNRLQIGSHF